MQSDCPPVSYYINVKHALLQISFLKFIYFFLFYDKTVDAKRPQPQTGGHILHGDQPSCLLWGLWFPLLSTRWPQNVKEFVERALQCVN